MISKKTKKYFEDNNYIEVKNENSTSFEKIINGHKFIVLTSDKSIKKQYLFPSVQFSQNSYKNYGDVENVDGLIKAIDFIFGEKKIEIIKDMFLNKDGFYQMDFNIEGCYYVKKTKNKEDREKLIQEAKYHVFKI